MASDLSDEDFFAAEEPRDDSALRRRVNIVLENSARISALEEELSEAKSLQRELLTKEIPDLMRELGFDSIKDKELGYEILIEDDVAGLPADPEERVAKIAALDDIGIYEILKGSFSIETGPKSLEGEVLKALFEVELFEVEENYMKSKSGGGMVPEIPDEVRSAISVIKAHTNINMLKSDMKFAPHWQTFRRWAKDRIADGYGDVFDKANIWHGKIAKLKEIKK